LEIAPRLLLVLVRRGLAMSEVLGRAELTTAMLDLLFKAVMMPRRLGDRVRGVVRASRSGNCRTVRSS
jgi:hypothetical protein